MMKYGLCSNFGNNCDNANQRVALPIMEGEDFVCPNCGDELIPKQMGEGKPAPRLLKVAGVILALAVVGFGFGHLITNRLAQRATAITADSLRKAADAQASKTASQPDSKSDGAAPAKSLPAKPKQTATQDNGPEVENQPASEAPAKQEADENEVAARPAPRKPHHARRKWNVPGE